jgi:hypothetical protein
VRPWRATEGRGRAAWPRCGALHALSAACCLPRCDVDGGEALQRHRLCLHAARVTTGLPEIRHARIERIERVETAKRFRAAEIDRDCEAHTPGTKDFCHTGKTGRNGSEMTLMFALTLLMHAALTPIEASSRAYSLASVRSCRTAIAAAENRNDWRRGLRRALDANPSAFPMGASPVKSRR